MDSNKQSTRPRAGCCNKDGCVSDQSIATHGEVLSRTPRHSPNPLLDGQEGKCFVEGMLVRALLHHKFWVPKVVGGQSGGNGSSEA